MNVDQKQDESPEKDFSSRLINIFQHDPVEVIHQNVLRACWKNLSSQLDNARIKQLESSGLFIPAEFLNANGTIKTVEWTQENRKRKIMVLDEEATTLANKIMKSDATLKEINRLNDLVDTINKLVKEFDAADTRVDIISKKEK